MLPCMSQSNPRRRRVATWRRCRGWGCRWATSSRPQSPMQSGLAAPRQVELVGASPSQPMRLFRVPICRASGAIGAALGCEFDRGEPTAPSGNKDHLPMGEIVRKHSNILRETRHLERSTPPLHFTFLENAAPHTCEETTARINGDHGAGDGCKGARVFQGGGSLSLESLACCDAKPAVQMSTRLHDVCS